MFAAQTDQGCLRQGDILAEIPFPRLSAKDVLILGSVAQGERRATGITLAPATHTHRDDPGWLTGQLPIRTTFCIIISQCCDLEPRHGRIETPAFAVARLIAVPKRIVEDPQRLARLRANKDPRDSSDHGYINLFHIPAHSSLQGREWVVDYNQLLSIPSIDFPGVLARKILQMDDASRVKFKIKLAASLGRLTDEEIKANLHERW
jgi:hypothetical protein